MDETIHFDPADVVEKITNWRKVDLNVAATPGSLQLYHNMLYHGNPTYPQVGDVRVWFEMAGRTEPGNEDKVKSLASFVCINLFPTPPYPSYFHSFLPSLPPSLAPSHSFLSFPPQISIVAKQLPGGVLTTFPSHIHPGYNILYVYMEKLTMDVSCITSHSHSHSPFLSM